jgi:hypothetical protein
LNHYYVYYRVSAENAGDAEVLVRSMQARLACRSGVAGRLLTKRDEPGLWMEVYEDVSEPERFEHLLHQAVDEFDLAMFVDGARKLECFTGDKAENRPRPCFPGDIAPGANPLD